MIISRLSLFWNEENPSLNPHSVTDSQFLLCCKFVMLSFFATDKNISPRKNWGEVSDTVSLSPTDLILQTIHTTCCIWATRSPFSLHRKWNNDNKKKTYNWSRPSRLLCLLVEYRVIQFDGWAQFETEVRHQVRLGQQEKGFAVNFLVYQSLGGQRTWNTIENEACLISIHSLQFFFVLTERILRL